MNLSQAGLRKNQTKARHLLKYAEILLKMMHMNIHNTKAILTLAETHGLLRVRDVNEAGAKRGALAQLVANGQLVKLARGLYALPERAASSHNTLAEVAAKSTQGVVCLLSALRYHGITTLQAPEVWLAIGHKAHAPKIDYPSLRIIRMSGNAMTAGIEVTDISGTQVRVFCVAKTVADCFKYRSKIGLDVALEALREAWRAKRVTMDELWQYATICRVANVMRPYLEMLGAME